MSISSNLERVRADVAQACRRAGRPREQVRLMAVSKTQPAEAILEAYASGQRLFGENRVQEAASKAAALAGLDALEVHLIGPLQNNKTARAAELFHSVDTIEAEKTGARLNSAAAALGRVLPILLEVKLSPEAAKHGMAPGELAPLLNISSAWQNLRVTGLMTVPPPGEDPELARPYFRRLREMRDAHQARFPLLTELSMGMSGDFAVAVEEGSTLVRIGTAIFGTRPS